MSSILKALRRLEEEKARQSQSAPEIAANLLREPLRRRRQLPVWFWPVMITGGALVALLVFAALRPPHSTSDPPARPALSERAAPVSTPAVVVEEIIDPQPVKSALPATVPPETAVKATKSAPTTPVATLRPVVPPAPAAGVSAALPVTLPERHRDLQLTAIIWQQERTARMAIINSLPVMEGESVNNSRIIEIAPDRVIFEENGRQFSLPLKPTD